MLLTPRLEPLEPLALEPRVSRPCGGCGVREVVPDRRFAERGQEYCQELPRGGK